MPGEYAAHEGDERALFAVLEGRIEAVKLVDGIERVVGERQPGRHLRRGADHARHGLPGRLPRRRAVARHADRGARLPRASRPCAPDVGEEVGRLAAHRIGGARGLQGLAAEPPPPRAIVVGHRWDAACAELRRFLDRNQVTFRWLTPDAPDAAEQWGGPLPADADWPAIRVIGGKTVVRPQLRRVAELLGLGTEPTPRSTTP